MAATDKDTIYIDIDDEITGIIDKVKNSSGKVVALVLPKRASVFQSIVNMKLLKRAADSDKKNLVLITSEAGLLPLAGAAGVHVAKTLNSKPEIPVAPDMNLDKEETVDETTGEEIDDAPLDPKAAVGVLAGAGAVAAVANKDENGMETVTLDNSDLPSEAPASGAPKSKNFDPKAKGAAAAKKPKKDKKLKIPDFNRFRLLLIAGGLALLLLIIGFIFANSSLQKATISIQTDATKVDASMDLNLSTTAKQVDPSTNTIPAKLGTVSKTYTQQVPTTGQKNNGNKAAGSVTVTNCARVDGPINIPAGSGFSSNGNTYISQEGVTVPESKLTGGSQKCASDTGKATVSVIAQNGGSSYNLPAGASFTVSLGISGLTGSGGTLSGGTDNITKTVNQNDINNAKAKIVVNDAEQKQALNDQLKKENYFPVQATYTAGTPAVTASAPVGTVADNVTVTETVTYTMFGVPKKDLNTLVDNAIKDRIDTGKQSVLDNGVDKLVVNVNSMTATAAQLTVSISATAGPDLDVTAIKTDAAGKKPGPIKDSLKTNPDVTSVDIKLSPFWVSSVPKNTSKIKVIIAKPTASNKSNSSNGSNP